MLIKLKLNKKYFAFTIIELSIVMLVISAIIVGISSTKLMIRKARLANAQSLTQDSIVGDLSDDLVAWYETSLDSSFLSSELKNDGSNISTWKDNNINAVNKNDATMTTAANQPKLYQNAFYDSIPGLRFDGNNDYLNFNLSKIVNSNYLIFIVEKRNNILANCIIGGNSFGHNTAIHVGYFDNSPQYIRFAHFGEGTNADFSTPAFKANDQVIHTFSFNGSTGKRYSKNGKIIGTVNQLAPLVSNNSVTIGKFGSGYYNGDLAEIIIFKRSLKTEEIEAVESYLGSKYGISVS